MVREVIRSQDFIDSLYKLDNSYLERIEKLVIKIITNPEIGKPMKHSNIYHKDEQ